MKTQATRTLRDEHRLILAVSARLQEVMEPPDARPDLDLVEDCVAFIRLFADACHHGQEEDVLFEELQALGMPRDSGPIAVMLEEHRIGRMLVGRMRDALPGAREDDEDAWARLRGAALDYVTLIRGHIAKEDGVLFTHADHVLGTPACARLCDAYDASCARRFEGRTRADLEDLARRIVGG